MKADAAESVDVGDSVDEAIADDDNPDLDDGDADDVAVANASNVALIVVSTDCADGVGCQGVLSLLRSSIVPTLAC